MRKEFYEKALPTQGTYCVALINPQTKRTYHEFADSHEDLNALLAEATNQTECNVYVTPCSFDGHSRSADNALFGRSFFIDLDVNHGKVCYESKEEALAALDKFVEDSGLPPPIRIDSGGGVQAYWLFEDDIPAEEWKHVAGLFKQYCIDKELLIDPAVTADAARVMRCPETLNLRIQAHAKFIDTEFNQYDFAAFKEFLGAESTDTAQSIEVIRSNVGGKMDEETRAIAKLDNFEDSFALLVDRSFAGNGCNQIRYAVENRASLNYGMWFAALSIAERCTDREQAIKMVSEDHPDYTYEAAEAKAAETRKASGPHTCSRFKQENPEGCEGCPFLGQITSPIQLAKRLRTPALPVVKEGEEIEEDTVWGEAPDQDLMVFPQYLEPFARGVNGGIYYTPPVLIDKTGKRTQEPPFQIINHTIYPYKRMFGVSDGECFMVRTVMPKDGFREFMLPVDHAYSQEHLTKAIVKSGVSFDPDRIKLVMAYFRRWSEYLSTVDRAEQMRMQMGWTKDKDAFVIGNNEVTADGQVVRAASSPLVRAVSQHLKMEGSYEVWQQSANALNEPGFEMHAFGMLTGFGSPLMCLTGVAGASICFLSANSGSGKTGSMYAAISIWGHPKDLSLVDKGATTNGFIGRYLNLKNIPFGIDEASNAKIEDLANLIHSVSHGKAKVRMQSSVNAEREHEDSASLIAFMTSNQSIYDKLQQLKGSPDGEMARLIEFTIEKPPQMSGERGYDIFNKFKFHYGHAGIAFIKYYFEKGEPYAMTLVEKWTKRFIQMVGDDSGYRFYQNLIAATFAGGELAVEAGIVKLDLERIFHTVMMEIIKLKDDTVKLNKTDYPALVTEFLFQNWAGMLVLNEPNKVVREPILGRPLVARSEIHNGMQYLNKTEFKKFLAQKQVSTREFEKAMEKDGSLVKVDRHRLSTGWNSGIHSNPIAVYALKVKLTDDLIAKLNESNS